MSCLDRWICGVSGHRDALKAFEDGRVYLRCPCGYESPGWQVRPSEAHQVIPMPHRTRRIVRAEEAA